MISFRRRILFIRHGETDYNREGRLQGQQDHSAQSRKGREQASSQSGATLRKLAGPRRSTGSEQAHAFRRLAATAHARNDGARARRRWGSAPTIMTVQRCVLKELTFGDWEGLTWPEVEASDPAGAAARAADKWRFTPPNGESYAALAERLRPWAEGLEGDVFVAAHGGVARALMHLIADLPPLRAAEADIHQGRALVFTEGAFRWLG